MVSAYCAKEAAPGREFPGRKTIPIGEMPENSEGLTLALKQPPGKVRQRRSKPKGTWIEPYTDGEVQGFHSRGETDGGQAISEREDLLQSLLFLLLAARNILVAG